MKGNQELESGKTLNPANWLKVVEIILLVILIVYVAYAQIDGKYINKEVITINCDQQVETWQEELYNLNLDELKYKENGNGNG